MHGFIPFWGMFDGLFVIIVQNIKFSIVFELYNLTTSRILNKFIPLLT